MYMVIALRYTTITLTVFRQSWGALPIWPIWTWVTTNCVPCQQHSSSFGSCARLIWLTIISQI